MVVVGRRSLNESEVVRRVSGALHPQLTNVTRLCEEKRLSLS